MTKKKDKESPENQELVNALESIRGLLEKSESKLSAARESLRKAKPPSNHIFRTTASQSSEPVVPVLDEVIPLEDSDFVFDPDNLDVDLSDTAIPELPLEEVALDTDGHREEDDEETEPTSTNLQQPLDLPPPDSGIDEVELNVLLDDFKADLEKQLHETILQTMIQIEMDIKEAMESELDKLKEKLLKHS